MNGQVAGGWLAGWLERNPENPDLEGKLLGHDPNLRVTQVNSTSPPAGLLTCKLLQGEGVSVFRDGPCDALASMWIIIPHDA